MLYCSLFFAATLLAVLPAMLPSFRQALGGGSAAKAKLGGRSSRQRSCAGPRPQKRVRPVARRKMETFPGSGVPACSRWRGQVTQASCLLKQSPLSAGLRALCGKTFSQARKPQERNVRKTCTQPRALKRGTLQGKTLKRKFGQGCSANQRVLAPPSWKRQRTENAVAEDFAKLVGDARETESEHRKRHPVGRGWEKVCPRCEYYQKCTAQSRIRPY